jgi:hypothetical protein
MQLTIDAWSRTRLAGWLLLGTLAMVSAAGCKRSTPSSQAPAVAEPPGAPTAAALADAAVENADPRCGGTGQPDCPLQSWMERELSARLNTAQWRPLAEALHKLSAHAPTAYPRWGDLAEAVATAAVSEDERAVRAACAGCHDTLREDYRRRMRGRAAPAP